MLLCGSGGRKKVLVKQKKCRIELEGIL